MPGLARPPCETPQAQGPDKTAKADTRWVLPATILGSSLAFIDGSVVNVALPAMQRGLQTDLGTMQWVVNGYMLTLASLILLGGSSGDRFGRRRVFTIGLAGFAAASVACGLAPSASWLIGARLVQGAAAALLTPASLAIVGAAYEGEARGPAIGTWAAAAALTSALGPPLGGWLVDTVGWRSIFFINPPIAVAALLLALKLPSDRGTETAQPLDWSGSVLALLTLALLSYGLIALGEGALTTGALVLAGAAPVGVAFVRREAAANAPMLPLLLFKNTTFSGANALTVVLYAALGSGLFLLPFMLIQIHGYNAMAAGAALLPFSVIMGAGSRWSGGLVDRFGARVPLTVGPALTAAGFAVLAVSGDDPDYWSGFLPGLVIMALGMTIAVPPLTTTVFDASPDDRSGTASGINNAAARGGSLVAVAALGLAFGGTAPGDFGGETLTRAYRLVMFSAAALAALGAAIAVFTIGARPERE